MANEEPTTEGQSEIPQGAWFKPFPQGADTTHFHLNRESYRSNTRMVKITGMDPLEISAIRDREVSFDGDLGVFYFDGMKTQLIKEVDLQMREDIDESQLVDITTNIFSISEKDPSRKYIVRLKFPDGIIIEKSYEDGDPSLGWHSPDFDDDTVCNAIPDTPFILGQIEMSVSIE